ncbi:MAG: YncE family protein [Acidobacteriota bacterium]|nr:YncE family protein [Acidobacteriota bacterium]
MKRLRCTRVPVLLGLFVLVGIAASAVAQKPYHILKTWTLPDAGWWDYLVVDPPAHRLYITRGDHMDVVDSNSGKIIGTISEMKGIHGIAFDATGKYGYISDGGANEVVVFDRSTLKKVTTIPTGAGADAIMYEPVTNTIWTWNGHGHSATKIDAATFKPVVTIPLPGKPEFAVADGHGLIYDNIEDKSEIVRIDAKTGTVTATWPLKDCESPSGLAYDAAGKRLFPVCDGKHMGVVDATSGKTIATATIGEGPDAARWSAKHKLAFASCGGSGELAVVDASTPAYKTIEMLPTMRGARTMAYDTANDRFYLVTAKFGPRPKPTPENPYGRPPMLPGSFTVIVVGR